jgi:uncharacterized protein YlxW (UPF0749 family)
VLVFALTRLSEDAERTVNAADVIRAKCTDSEAEVADLRARLQRSELTASALLESFRSFRTLRMKVGSARIGSEGIAVFDGSVG